MSGRTIVSEASLIALNKSLIDSFKLSVSKLTQLKQFDKLAPSLNAMRALNLRLSSGINKDKMFNAVFNILLNSPSLEFVTIKGGFSPANAKALLCYLQAYTDLKHGVLKLKGIRVVSSSKQEFEMESLASDRSLSDAFRRSGFEANDKTISEVGQFISSPIVAEPVDTFVSEKDLLARSFEYFDRRATSWKKRTVNSWPSAVVHGFENTAHAISSNKFSFNFSTGLRKRASVALDSLHKALDGASPASPASVVATSFAPSLSPVGQKPSKRVKTCHGELEEKASSFESLSR